MQASLGGPTPRQGSRLFPMETCGELDKSQQKPQAPRSLLWDPPLHTPSSGSAARWSQGCSFLLRALSSDSEKRGSCVHSSVRRAGT